MLINIYHRIYIFLTRKAKYKLPSFWLTDEQWLGIACDPRTSHIALEDICLSIWAWDELVAAAAKNPNMPEWCLKHLVDNKKWACTKACTAARDELEKRGISWE